MAFSEDDWRAVCRTLHGVAATAHLWALDWLRRDKKAAGAVPPWSLSLDRLLVEVARGAAACFDRLARPPRRGSE